MSGLTTGQYYAVTRLPDALTSRNWPSLVHYKANIFVIGGWRLKSMDRFSIEGNTWSTAPPMNQERDRHSSCVLGDKIYSFGGEDSNGYLSSIEGIDCGAVVGGESAQWETLQLANDSHTIQPRTGAIMTPIGTSHILIAGGWSGARLGD